MAESSPKKPKASAPRKGTQSASSSPSRRPPSESPAGTHSRPDHSSHLKRLNRIKGQIEGIERMIVGHRYCPDILTQIRAATSALQAVEVEIFRDHLKGCVRSAFQSRDTFDSEEKIQEIIKMIS
ncbi:MAG: metal-sensitive transcriptional regulator [Bdellovibrionales bacterium]